MASGDTLFRFKAGDLSPPDADAATPDWLLRNSANEPDALIQVLDFDPGATNEFAIGDDILPANYAGTTGITLKIGYFTESVGGEVVRWEAAFTSFTDNVDNILTKVSAAAQAVNDTASAAARVLNVATITFTDGAQIDSLAAGEAFMLRINRDSADAADTMNANDAELWYVYGYET